MGVDIVTGRTADAKTQGGWLFLGGVTLAAMVLAWLALDDITTDNATRFPAEYSMLAVAGAWLLFIAWQLWRSGSRANSLLTIASLAAATLMAAGGIGHKRDGGWAVFWPRYIPLTWAWIHGIVVGILMIRRGLKEPAEAGSHER
jgi:peptidoglycan/LPS O-acetylase OafA/YrhL